LCYLSDTSYCMPGVIDEVWDDIECDPVTHECREK
jgi:hypothetical protein